MRNAPRVWLGFLLLLALRSCPVPCPAQVWPITNSTPEKALSASNLVNVLNHNFSLLAASGTNVVPTLDTVDDLQVSAVTPPAFAIKDAVRGGLFLLNAETDHDADGGIYLTNALGTRYDRLLNGRIDLAWWAAGDTNRWEAAQTAARELGYPIDDGATRWWPAATTHARLLGTLRTNLVQAAPYGAVEEAAANIGPTSGETSYEWMGYAHQYRVRQNGEVAQVKVYTGALTSVTGLYVKVWRRRTGGTYDLIATSANLVGSCSAGTANLLAVTLAGVEEGDFIGGRLTFSGASAQVLRAKSVANAVTYSVLNASPSSSGYDWEAQTASSGVIVPVECYMVAPYFVAIGDSIMSGRLPHISFADSYTDTTSIEAQMPYGVGRAAGWTYQNMGISGNTMNQMSARFSADVISLQPRFVILEGGVNDLLGGTSAATILGYYSNVLSACVTANIVPVICGVLPFRGYGSGGSDALSTAADTINAALQSMASGYNGIFVDPSELGIFYPGGTDGNRWRLKPELDGGDGIHLSARGQLAWAALVLRTLGVQENAGNVSAASLAVGGGISLDGESDQRIAVRRTRRYRSAGHALTLGGGGNVGGIADLDGGDVIIESGPSTGTGKSKLSVRVPNLSATGTTENAPVEVFTVARFSLAGAVYANLISAAQDAVFRVWDGGSYKGGFGYDSTTGGVGIYGSSDGDNPPIILKTASFDVNKLLQVTKSVDGVDQNSAVAKFFNSTTNDLWVSYSTAKHRGLIGAVTEGVAHRPLVLNPKGGSFAVGVDTNQDLVDFVTFYTTMDNIVRLSGVASSNLMVRFYEGSTYLGGMGLGNSGNIGFYDDNNGTIPKLGIGRTGQAGFFNGTNGFTFSGGTGPKVLINGGTDTADQNTAQMRVGRDATYYGWMGYNQASNKFYLGAVQSGTGHKPVSISPLGGGVEIGGGTAILSVYSATATLDFASTSSQSETDLTMSVAGAAVGDVVALGVPNGSITAGGCFTAWVSATDTVTVRFSNYSSGAKDPASGTFRVQVTHF